MRALADLNVYVYLQFDGVQRGPRTTDRSETRGPSPIRPPLRYERSCQVACLCPVMFRYAQLGSPAGPPRKVPPFALQASLLGHLKRLNCDAPRASRLQLAGSSSNSAYQLP